jgi:DHA1 family bicyclomycin/chloramphenicol resistance-like MFS transporter
MPDFRLKKKNKMMQWNKVRKNTDIEWLIRLLLGGVFLYAGIHKIGNPAQFAKIIYGYGLFPGVLINPAAIILPFVEVYTGFSLVIGVYPRAAAFILGIMLSVFIFAITINLMRGYSFDCGCFSFGEKTSGMAAAGLLARDFLLLMMVIHVLCFRGKRRRYYVHETGNIKKNIMKTQETINKNRFLLLLALLCAFPPIATDMYLSAIPFLQKLWHQPLAIVNLTLVGFFISYCVFMLFYGPLSDRYGRRPLLMVGIGFFILASLLCALAENVVSLIVFRVLQGGGAASASALALAISKDVYEGHERERILACIGVIMAMAPMLAPVFGGWMIARFSWRWIFVLQGTIGVIAWLGVFRMPETLEKPSATNVVETAGIYLELLRNRGYVGHVLMMSLIVLPHFAFIGGSADIYISRLGLSEQVFSYFFAMNASAIMAGSFACTQLLPRVGARVLITTGFTGILIGGAGMLIGGLSGPWGLALPMVIVSFSFGISRPPSNNLVLEQVEQHSGAASSLMIFIYFTLGAFAMWLISLDWDNKIHVIGILGTASGGMMLVCWLLLPGIAVKKKMDLYQK